jgi:hypothetical protein
MSPRTLGKLWKERSVIDAGKPQPPRRLIMLVLDWLLPLTVFMAYVSLLYFAASIREITILGAGIMALLGGLTLWFAKRFIDSMRFDGPPRVDSHWGGLGGGLGGWRLSASLVYLIGACAFGVLVTVTALRIAQHDRLTGAGGGPSAQSSVAPATKEQAKEPPKEQAKEPPKEPPKE